MNSDYRVRPLSREDIFGKAHALREALGLGRCRIVPIVKVIECGLPQLFDGFNYRIVPKEEMPDREAVTYPAQGEIAIREDTYCKACADDPHARFTLGHELGHFFLHPPGAVYLAVEEGQQPVKPFLSPEWQANVFAGEFLAPIKLVLGMTSDEIAEKFLVSYSAARIQADFAFSFNCFGHCREREPLLPGFVMP